MSKQFLDTLTMSTSTVATIVSIFIVCVVMVNAYKYPKLLEHEKKQKYVSFAGILFHCFNAIFDFIGWTVITDKSALSYLIIWTLQSLLWGLGNGTTHFLFILRLKSTFQHTAYQTSNIIYYSLYLSLIIFFVCHLEVLLIYNLFYFDIINSNQLKIGHMAELWPKFVSDVYLSILLTYLFVTKLMLLSTKTIDFKISDRITTPSHKSQTNLTEYEMNDIIADTSKITHYDRKFIQVATRMTILATIMALSTMLFFAYALISQFIINTNVGQFMWFTVPIIATIDGLINSFCIFLSLPYKICVISYRYVCQPCHKCCFYYKEKNLLKQKYKISSRIINDNYVMLNDNDNLNL
eukprot:200017_1